MLQGKQLYISFITELELLGLNPLSAVEEKQIETLLDDCITIPLSDSIKHQYKTVRKESKLKLADSLIAATALSLHIPLVTADKQFKTLKMLSLIQYER